ncbi:MAG TPA: CBS domain-containing protein [Pseudonocardia sp.]|jgi:CBS domain-containing protein
MTTGPRHLAAPPETIDEDPPITQLMTTRLVGITPDAPLSTALRVMATTGVRHLPVLDGDRCRGIVHEVDIARFLSGGFESPASRVALHVEDLARPTEPLPTTARRCDAALRMQTEHVDAVLVTDRDRLIGIVTATDLIRSLAAVTFAADHQNGTPL